MNSALPIFAFVLTGLVWGHLGMFDRPATVASATVPQIATFTGHSLKDVEAMLDGHYLGRDVQMAEAAVLKLEQRTKL